MTQKLAEHGAGTALLHARTEAGWFEPIWRSATAILFMADRIKFCRPDGSEQPANSGAPPVLVAFGHADAERLKQSGIPGALVTAWTELPGLALATRPTNRRWPDAAQPALRIPFAR
jgi:hypothetical protein